MHTPSSASSRSATYRQRKREGSVLRKRRTAAELAALDCKPLEQRTEEEKEAVRNHRKVLNRKQSALISTPVVVCTATEMTSANAFFTLFPISTLAPISTFSTLVPIATIAPPSSDEQPAPPPTDEQLAPLPSDEQQAPPPTDEQGAIASIVPMASNTTPVSSHSSFGLQPIMSVSLLDACFLQMRSKDECAILQGSKTLAEYMHWQLRLTLEYVQPGHFTSLNEFVIYLLARPSPSSWSHMFVQPLDRLYQMLSGIYAIPSFCGPIITALRSVIRTSDWYNLVLVARQSNVGRPDLVGYREKLWFSKLRDLIDPHLQPCATQSSLDALCLFECTLKDILTQAPSSAQHRAFHYLDLLQSTFHMCAMNNSSLMTSIEPSSSSLSQSYPSPQSMWSLQSPMSWSFVNVMIQWLKYAKDITKFTNEGICRVVASPRFVVEKILRVLQLYLNSIVSCMSSFAAPTLQGDDTTHNEKGHDSYDSNDDDNDDGDNNNNKHRSNIHILIGYFQPRVICYDEEDAADVLAEEAPMSLLVSRLVMMYLHLLAGTNSLLRSRVLTWIDMTPEVWSLFQRDVKALANSTSASRNTVHEVSTRVCQSWANMFQQPLLSSSTSASISSNNNNKAEGNTTEQRFDFTAMDQSELDNDDDDDDDDHDYVYEGEDDADSETDSEAPSSDDDDTQDEDEEKKDNQDDDHNNMTHNNTQTKSSLAEECKENEDDTLGDAKPTIEDNSVPIAPTIAPTQGHGVSSSLSSFSSSSLSATMSNTKSNAKSNLSPHKRTLTVLQSEEPRPKRHCTLNAHINKNATTPYATPSATPSTDMQQSTEDVVIKQEPTAVNSLFTLANAAFACLPPYQQQHQQQQQEVPLTEVTIVKLVSSKIQTECGVTFNTDGARTEVRPSLLVPGQSGLFACEAIAQNVLITWYTGKQYRSIDKMNSRGGPTAKDDDESSFYVMDVESEGVIKYFIDGWTPDSRFGGQERCLATYINHHRQLDNVAFVVRKVSGVRGLYVYRVAIQATRNIAAGEELLSDYGDVLHERLKSIGVLVE